MIRGTAGFFSVLCQMNGLFSSAVKESVARVNACILSNFAS